MTLFMETTVISAEQTVGEIQRLLGRCGASAILVEYKDGEVDAVAFKIEVQGQQIPFRLPCRWRSIYSLLLNRKKNMTHDEKIILAYEAKAKRVAWRQILRWVEAQLALVETNMVQIQEVFMPYIQGPSGETLYERLEGSKFNLLEYKS